MMEISGSGGTGNAALLHQWRERLLARTGKEVSGSLLQTASSATRSAEDAEVSANPAGSQSPGPRATEGGPPPEPPPGQTGSLSDQMLGVLFGAQEAGGTEAEVAAQLAAMLESALKAYQPVVPTPDSA